jgi:hypothetical protein
MPGKLPGSDTTLQWSQQIVEALFYVSQIWGSGLDSRWSVAPITWRLQEKFYLNMSQGVTILVFYAISTKQKKFYLNIHQLVTMFHAKTDVRFAGVSCWPAPPLKHPKSNNQQPCFCWRAHVHVIVFIFFLLPWPYASCYVSFSCYHRKHTSARFSTSAHYP